KVGQDVCVLPVTVYPEGHDVHQRPFSISSAWLPRMHQRFGVPLEGPQYERSRRPNYERAAVGQGSHRYWYALEISFSRSYSFLHHISGIISKHMKNSTANFVVATNESSTTTDSKASESSDFFFRTRTSSEASSCSTLSSSTIPTSEESSTLESLSSTNLSKDENTDPLLEKVNWLF